MSGKQLHYGTISRWFANRRAGAITTEYNGTCSVILSAAELPEDYQHPQVGATVRFAIGRVKSAIMARAVRIGPPLARILVLMCIIQRLCAARLPSP